MLTLADKGLGGVWKMLTFPDKWGHTNADIYDKNAQKRTF